LTIDIIGAGFSGLVAACFLSKEGYNVNVFEKHSTPGGRARNFKVKGFTFDMGPSWYWMPEMVEKLFKDLGKNIDDYLELERLDPAYQVLWNDNTNTKIPADLNELCDIFDDLEPNGGKKIAGFFNRRRN
jgi:phytoene desaturase